MLSTNSESQIKSLFKEQDVIRLRKRVTIRDGKKFADEWQKRQFETLLNIGQYGVHLTGFLGAGGVEGLFGRAGTRIKKWL